MKLIIFIGHFKTGSTSIQHFLAANYLSLLRAGILYPAVESRGVSHNLRTLAEGGDRSVREAGLNVVEPHNALALRLKNEEDGHGVPDYYPNLPGGFQMLELLANQIVALDPAITILCSEVFSLLGVTSKRNSVQRLRRRFAHHEVTIYCNLRRPDEHLSSWHRQRLKFGAKLHRFDAGAINEYLGGAHFRYAAMINGWLDAFPKAALVLRNFEDVKAGGDSVTDFVRATGLSLPDNLYYPGRLNPSLPSAFFEIARRAIWELPSDISGDAVSWLIRASECVSHIPDSQIEMFGIEARQLALREFRRVSFNLDKLYGKGKFFSDIERIGVCRPVSDLDAARQALPDLIRHANTSEDSAGLAGWLSSLKIDRGD